MKLSPLLGEPSWEFHSDMVSAALTRSGGHLGPVEFVLDRNRTVQPLHVAPWAGASAGEVQPPVLRVLRGDFFCMPFGANGSRWQGEQHPVHGETANADWACESIVCRGPWTVLTASLATSIRPASVKKILKLHAGHRAVYMRHVIAGARGPMPVGHHAMLYFPEGETGRISFPRLRRAQVLPSAFENPAEGGYSCLKPGALFPSLSRVPMLAGGFADLTTYPAREGYEDLVMLAARPPTPLGWSAAVFPARRFVWFTLKDSRVLPATVLWHSNGGRHYPPWSGRHRRVLGIEEVISYFHNGLAQSAAPNPWSRAGIPTALRLHPSRPTMINLIMGVAVIPRDFDITEEIRPAEDGIVLKAKSGATVRCPLDLGFLEGAEEDER